MRSPDLPLALLDLVMTNMRTIMGSMDLDQLLSHRDDDARLLTVIDAASEPSRSRWRASKSGHRAPKDLVERHGAAELRPRHGERSTVILEAPGRCASSITAPRGGGGLSYWRPRGVAQRRLRAAEADRRDRPG